MILCEFTPTDGVMIRCATQDFAGNYMWKSFITSVASIKLSMPNAWGGYAEPSFSDISFSPDMFVGIWPPPETVTLKIIWLTTEEESEGVVIFEGSADRSELNRDSIKYDLKRPKFTAKINASVQYSDTLVTTMTTLCGPTLLNLTIDTTRARIPSPDVNYTFTTKTQAIDFANEMCAFFSHGFYIENGVLYLFDMYDYLTGQTELTEWDVLPSTYKIGTRYGTCKSGTYTVEDTTIENGEELEISTAYVVNEDKVKAALAIILQIANRPVIEINSVIAEVPMQIGQCYKLIDYSHFGRLTAEMISHDVVYNFDTEISQAVGSGRIGG